MKKEKPNSNATDSASPKRGEAVLLFAAIGGMRACRPTQCLAGNDIMS